MSDDTLTSAECDHMTPEDAYHEGWRAAQDSATKQLAAAEALSKMVSKWLIDEATYDDLDAAHRAYESASNG